MTGLFWSGWLITVCKQISTHRERDPGNRACHQGTLISAIHAGKITHSCMVVSLAYALSPVDRQRMIDSRHWVLVHCTSSMWTRNQWCCSLIMLVESFDTDWSTLHHCLSNKISSDRLFNSVQPSWRAADTSVVFLMSGTSVMISAPMP